MAATPTSTTPRPSLQPWLWSLFLALVMAVPLVRASVSPPLPPAPVLGTVPAVPLTDQTGAAFGTDRLAGRVWLASFIFTRCPSVCPTLTERLAGVQQQLGDAVDLVSYSVDPGHDTPERLAAFARAHGAASPRWHFVTGESAQVEAAITRGFKVGITREGPDAARDLTHGVHVVLVDGLGRIRGYYDSTDPDALERLVRDARALARRPTA